MSCPRFNMNMVIPFSSKHVITKLWARRLTSEPKPETFSSENKGEHGDVVPYYPFYYNMFSPHQFHNKKDVCESQSVDTCEEIPSVKKMCIISDVEMPNPYLSLPIIYMSRMQMKMSRSSKKGSVSQLSLNKRNYQVGKHNMQVAVVGSKPASKSKPIKEKGENKEEKQQEAKKQVEDKKKEATDMMASKVEVTDSEVTEEATKSINWMKGKEEKTDENNDKKTASTPSPSPSPSSTVVKGGGGSGGGWSSIESKLPVWQNTIAEVLQKLQDVIMRKRKK